MVLEKPKPAAENPLRLVDLPLPVPGAGEIRVRVRACGLCHTDLHTVEGDLLLPKLPVVPGHQIVGIVDGVGVGTHHFHAGDRVGVPWLYSTCGQCVYCRKGLENLCENARFTGYHADGGYAEAMVIPEDFAYPLPANFSDLEAAPMAQLRRVYESLQLPGFAAAEPAFRSYLDSVTGFQKNTYRIDDPVVAKVNRYWQFALDEWGYARLEPSAEPG